MDYYIGPNGELYHGLFDKGEPRDDHKYIKREWKKGKWVYTYPSDVKKNRSKNLEVKNVAKRGNGITATIGKSDPLARVKKAIDKALKGTSKPKVKPEVDAVNNAATTPSRKAIEYDVKEFTRFERGVSAANKAVQTISDVELNTTVKDTFKYHVDNFMNNVRKVGFGEAVFNIAVSKFTSMKVDSDTPDSFSELKKIDSNMTDEAHQSAINPGYDPNTYDYSMNCSFCTAAYDLRKRGYDVEANPISMLEAYTIEDVVTWYDGAEVVYEQELDIPKQNDMYTEARATVLEKNLEKHGNGARGHMGLYWSNGGGHDIIWEVENGKAVFRDCQTNKEIDIRQYLEISDGYSYVRIDDCEPTEAVLRTVRNRK